MVNPSLCVAAIAATSTSILEVGKKTVFGSAPTANCDYNDPVHLIPSKSISLNYLPPKASPDNAADPVLPDTHLNITHLMKYPTILLEEIGALIDVTCSSNSIALTFNDSSVFSTVRSVWSANLNQTLILVTNHLGDCDAELERGFFVAQNLRWDSQSLVCTAKAKKTDVEHTAETTEITFGGLPANALRKRALVLDPSFTLGAALSLPERTTLFKHEPYVSVIADTAYFAAEATISGYLKYNWWRFKLEKLHFDLDASFDSKLGISASVQAGYNNIFSYAPDALEYGFIVPGILEVGPQLKFSVGALVAASASVNVSAAVGVKLVAGNVHLDLLNSKKTSTSGWNPAYFAEADISGQAVAQLHPSVALDIGLKVRFFGGLVDLSSGIAAKPGFTNTFTLSASEGASATIGGSKPASKSKLAGMKAVGAPLCPDGLAIDSDFNFALDAYVTKWWSGQLYSVSVPILDKCYSWR